MSDPKIPAWRSVIQYWAYNMNLIHRLAMEWPGFGYSDEEKEQLAALGSGVSGFRYAAFLLLNSTFFIALAAVVIWLGVMPMATMLDPEHKSGLLFLMCLALGAVLCLGFGIPATMGFTALTMNAISRPTDAGPVTEEQAAALYRKMSFQITRMGVIMSVLLVPLVIFGRTQLGEQVLAFVKSAIVMIMPFALLLTAMRALAPKLKR